MLTASLTAGLNSFQQALAGGEEQAQQDLIERYIADNTGDGIVRFVIEVLGVEEIAPYQEDILRAVVVHHRVCVRGPHGLGKTAVAAWLVLWGMATFPMDSKIPTTASNGRQLSKFLWPEIRSWALRADWGLVGLTVRDGFELLKQSFNLPGKEAFAVASNKPSNIEGAHGRALMYIFDEAKEIIGATFDAAEGAFSTAGADTGDVAYAFAGSTPGEPNGRFYDIQSRKTGYEDWHVIHVTKEEAIAAGRMSREWCLKRIRQWGEHSQVCQNRVFGNFATSAEDNVISLDWVEAANERWLDWVDADRPGDFQCLGLDVGRGGDKSVFAIRIKGEWDAIDTLRIDDQPDTMRVTGIANGILNRYGGKLSKVIADVIGIGAGVIDRLRELGFEQVDAFNAGSRSERLDMTGELGFVNRRSAAWWNMREMLDPANQLNVALPPDSDDILIGDLTTPKWTVVSGGKIKVESKDDIKKRLERSTDYGDAVIQAFDPGEFKVTGLPWMVVEHD